jgi:hypothetical protein
MPTESFVHNTEYPVVLVPGQTLDVQAFIDFDPNGAVTHFKFKMHAEQDAAEALYYFKVQFFNEAMEESDVWSGSPITIQDGWIGEAGEAWGISILPEDQSVFVSDHAHYGTTEGPFTAPAYLGPYEAEDGGTVWENNVIEEKKTENHLPTGGTWYIRLVLDAAAPSNVTVKAFSLEFDWETWYPRQIYSVPLTQGWVCDNAFPTPSGLYVILHRGFAYLYGEMLDWNNWNEDLNEDWFTEVYEDATTMLVEAGGLPEAARPSGRVVVPIRFYDFDRSSVALGTTWYLAIGADGSIKFLSKSGRPDKLRLGGGSYSFAPMQVRWPIADQSEATDTDAGGMDDLVWSVQNNLINDTGSESGDNQEWVRDGDITLATHGGITHLRAKVYHNDPDTSLDVPLWHTGGYLAHDAVKVLNTVPGVGQDFGFIQQFTLELSDIPAGATVNFDASSSTGQQPLAYHWNFGDGSTGSGKITSHVYTEPGTYWVKLTVTDPRDRTDSVTKRPRNPDPGEGYPGESNDWAAYVNDNGAVINAAGQHILFLSADPDTQVFKGEDVTPGTLGGAPGSCFIGADDIAPYFAADKNFIDGGMREASTSLSSPQMEYDLVSAVGRKYGVAICVQEDGSHYRHEVECTSISGGWPSGRPNTYVHKLYKNIGGADTLIAGPVTNDSPSCWVSGFISFSDVQSVRWQPHHTGAVFSVADTTVPKSGTWGFYIAGDVTVETLAVTGNAFPSYPPPGEIVNIEAWWPTYYEYDEAPPNP